MAAGWNAQLVVETWSGGGAVATSIGLAVATHHTGGRHVCVVPDEESRSEYAEAMRKSGWPAEVVIGRPDEAVEGLEGVDFAVVDGRRSDFAGLLREAKLGHRGAVLVCKNASARADCDFRWRSVLDGESRIVRSVFLPVGNGLDIVYVGARGGGCSARRRWIIQLDRRSGEEFVIRK